MGALQVRLPRVPALRSSAAAPDVLQGSCRQSAV